MKNKKANGKLIWAVLLAIPSLVLLFLEIFPPVYSSDKVMDGMLRILTTRSVGCFVFIPLAVYLGYNIFGLTKKSRYKQLLCTLVPLAVVVNNFPFIGVLTGNAYVTSPYWYIPVFALESLSIGLFEEFAFRGVLFPYILENRRSSGKSIFWSTVISSALFGGIHLFNLFAGGSPGAVLLQVGYSFLIGGMCAIVLLYTRCIWICVALHAIYDFCGYMIPTLGTGIIWDTATVVITAMLGVFALVFMLIWLFKITPDRADELYNKAASE